MWRAALNIESEIVVKSWDEYEAALKAGDYDVVRRGLVMQTTDELTNLKMLFQQDSSTLTSPTLNASSASARSREGFAHGFPPTSDNGQRSASVAESESQALKELKAVPIYFASSYALVKPYVSGFDANVLDAPSLKKTRISTDWTERRTASLQLSR